MTTLNNDELRKQILKEGKVSASVWRVTQRMYDDGYISDFTQTAQQIVEIPIDDLMQLIATHDQQLLEAILEGVKDKTDESSPIDEWLKAHPQVSSNLDHSARLQVAASRMFGYNDATREIRQHIKSVFNKEGE